MSTAAFALIAFMLATYVLLDGYDLGVAAITPLIARGDRQREGSMRSIGPFWNGNEVWLIAAGAALFALFPQAFAASFSGFYLPFIVVLWLLMFRGIAMELRSHFPSEIWHQFWDACFAGSSALLILVFGVALGNLLRGVPLDTNGYFMGTFAYLLNPYALLVGVFALAVLALHGATFVMLRIEGAPSDRARTLYSGLWIAALVLLLAVTVATFFVHSGLLAMPWIDAAGVLSLVSLAWSRVAVKRGRLVQAFAGSCAFIVALLVSAAATLYPYLIPAYPAGRGGLSIFDASPSPSALITAFTVIIVGVLAVIVYSSIVWRQFTTKVQITE